MTVTTARASTRVTLLVLLTCCAVLLGGSVAVSPASAGASAVTGVSAKPQPPKKVKISWNAYTGFTVDHYRVTLSPGFRVRTPSTTNTLFTDLNWGVDYSATVVAISDTGTESGPGEIALPGSMLTTSLKDDTETRGDRLVLNGKLTNTSGKRLADRRVEIQVDWAPRNGTFKSLGFEKTNDRGRFRTTTKAQRNGTFRVLYAKPDTAGGWAYEGFLVRARLNITHAPNRVQSGERFHIKGKVRAPAKLVKGKPIQLQKLSRKGRWVKVERARIHAESRFRFTHRAGHDGTTFWRVRTSPTKFFTTSVSPSVKVLVR